MAKKSGSGEKTNAARALDRLGIAYELRAYALSDVHLQAHEVAQAVGLPPEQVFKTLVTRGDRTGPLFAVVPSVASLDLKALAQASGNRRVELVPLKEVTAITGYIRGGTTVLAAKKALPAYVDESAATLASITVSAGRPGLQMTLAPADYLRATGSKYATLQAEGLYESAD